MANFSEITQRAALIPVQFYRYFVSPWMGNCCRFYPSCSQYAIEAIQRHGAFYGWMLAIKRVLKCHPWHLGGVDKVP